MRERRAGVACSNGDRFALARDLDREGALAVHGVARVDRQVEQGELDLVGVATSVTRVVGHAPLVGDPAAERAGEQLIAALEQSRELDPPDDGAFRRARS